MGRKSLTEKEFNAFSSNIISASKELILENGLNNLTIRKIADKVGINSAIIYRHFANFDELATFACLHIFEDYVVDLIQQTEAHPCKTAEESYLFSWKLFCRHCFEHPKSCYRIFFGKYAQNVTQYIKKYYELFPTNLKTQEVYENMLHRGDLYERNLIALEPVLKGEKTSQETKLINEITIAYFKHLLSTKIKNQKLENSLLTEKMLNACKFLIR